MPYKSKTEEIEYTIDEVHRAARAMVTIGRLTRGAIHLGDRFLLPGTSGETFPVAGIEGLQRSWNEASVDEGVLNLSFHDVMGVHEDLTAQLVPETDSIGIALGNAGVSMVTVGSVVREVIRLI